MTDMTPIWHYRTRTAPRVARPKHNTPTSPGLAEIDAMMRDRRIDFETAYAIAMKALAVKEGHIVTYTMPSPQFGATRARHLVEEAKLAAFLADGPKGVFACVQGIPMTHDGVRAVADRLIGKGLAERAGVKTGGRTFVIYALTEKGRA